MYHSGFYLHDKTSVSISCFKILVITLYGGRPEAFSEKSPKLIVKTIVFFFEEIHRCQKIRADRG